MINIAEPFKILFNITVYLVGFLGFYLYFFSVDFRRFSYYKKTLKIINLEDCYIRNIDSLYMTCNEERISNATITRIALWNSGTEDIYEKSIVKERPLVLGVKRGSGARILDCSVYYCTDEYNKFKPEKHLDEDEKYTFSFEYIEKRGGVILEVIHTGGTDDLYMDCFIKGGKGIIEIDKQESRVRKPSNKTVQAQYVRISKRAARFFGGSEDSPPTWHYGIHMISLSIFGLSPIIAVFIPASISFKQKVVNFGMAIAYFTFILSVIGAIWPYRMPYRLREQLQ